MKQRIIRGLGVLLAVVLTARMGTIDYDGHKETWYDLPMDKVVQRAKNMGIPTDMWVRDDGVKMFGNWVIVAAHKSKVRYTFIETSLGRGIILDYHECSDENLYDIATTWGKSSKQ